MLVLGSVMLDIVQGRENLPLTKKKNDMGIKGESNSIKADSTRQRA